MERPENTERPLDRPSGIPKLSSRSNGSNAAGGNNGGTLKPSATKHRFLSPAEWARVAHGLGAVHGESESHAVVHPTAWYWPPKGLPDGLYREVLAFETKYLYKFHVISVVRWALMVFQIALGACLTALGSLNVKDTTAITILAAINTLNAGLLALIHNSGLPDRYRMDKAEFSKVVDLIKEILETGVVESDKTVDQILSDCFNKFQAAKATVRANMPSQYTPTASSPSPNVVRPGLPPHDNKSE